MSQPDAPATDRKRKLARIIEIVLVALAFGWLITWGTGSATVAVVAVGVYCLERRGCLDKTFWDGVYESIKWPRL
jgi:hypothetical protein